MRIIAGKYRGRKLKSPPTLDTRPTSDRLRETLFNILAPSIEGARFLDLCAGSGAVGIEALSRGAARASFVEQSRKMCALIEWNTSALKIDAELIEIIPADAAAFLELKAKNSSPFDLVYFDPPYAADYEAIMKHLGDHATELLAKEAVVIVEHHKQKDLAERFGDLHRYRELTQGDSKLSFYALSST